MITSSSAIAEKPRCRVVSFWWVLGDGVGQSGANVVGSREEAPLNTKCYTHGYGRS